MRLQALGVSDIEIKNMAELIAGTANGNTNDGCRHSEYHGEWKGVYPKSCERRLAVLSMSMFCHERME
jgi:hypothetical protein